MLYINKHEIFIFQHFVEIHIECTKAITDECNYSVCTVTYFYRHWFCSADVHKDGNIVVAGDNVGNVKVKNMQDGKVCSVFTSQPYGWRVLSSCLQVFC